MKRILLTGAAGSIGHVVRDKLNGIVPTLRVSDIADLGEARPGEEIVPCDITDRAAVADLVKGCDGIIHLAGIPREATFDELFDANIRGTYNIFDAARLHGKPRIIYASSNHVTGFHDRTSRLDARSPMRPDTLYGVSKGYGELLGRFYFDKFGVENVAVRIGAIFDKPQDPRMMATWLSADDFVRLIEAVFRAPFVQHTMIYGASNNRESWWDNKHADFLGWHPQDSSDHFRAEMDADIDLADPNDPVSRFQGGTFARPSYFKD